MNIYHRPTLTDLGDVGSMTAAFGDPNEEDSLFINGVEQTGFQGSIDLCNTPEAVECAD